MGCTACTEPQCLYKGDLYLTVELYLYSPYGLYGLYRASVPVQGWPLPYSRAITLLSLWAVRPVQSLSACTRVQSTFLPLSRKRLQQRSIRCYTLPVEAIVYVWEREKEENSVWSFSHSVHLNVNKVATITAVLPVSCVTNEKEKEYYSRSYC